MIHLSEEMHQIVEKLTGDIWVPYPSKLFAEVILNPNISDQIKLELIKERRTFYFPSFLRGDPQYNKLIKLIGVQND